VKARRIPLGTSREELMRHEVEDAFAASPAERMAAAVLLLDTAYELWMK
jgi:hypothetical protein